MPWSIAPIGKQIQKKLDELGVSERRKYDEWAGRITGQNEHPATSAQSLGYEIKKLGGTQWELMVGSRARVSYSVDTGNTLVTLVGVGHT